MVSAGPIPELDVLERLERVRLQQEIVQDAQPFVAMGDLRVELDAEEAFVPAQRDRRAVLEKYWENFGAHHIAPYDPAPLDPLKVTWPKLELLPITSPPSHFCRVKVTLPRLANTALTSAAVGLLLERKRFRR